jgi:hypothetical protein
MTGCLPEKNILIEAKGYNETKMTVGKLIIFEVFQLQ